MTEPSPSTPNVGDERRRSIGRYVKRLGSVLRRESSRKSTALTPETSFTEPKAVTKETPAAAAPAAPTAPAASTDLPLVNKPAIPSSGPGTYPRSAVQQERARALFAKYGLTLEAHEWITAGTAATTSLHVQRVERPIRMRVHRNCHRCDTVFGADKVCSKCEHKRCKKCPRYPPKKNKDGVREGKPRSRDAAGLKAAGAAAQTARGLPATKATAATAAAAADAAMARKRKEQVTIKTRDGTERVFTHPKQRIRRSCHKCEAQFNPPTATVCTGCQHVRCTLCPREPAKTKKWPDGYPGDAAAEESEQEIPQLKKDRTWRKTRMRVRWNCCECQAAFFEGAKDCSECEHRRCDTCVRKPPKKAKKEYSPELLQEVQEKLDRFRMGDSQVADLTATTTPTAAGVAS